MALGKWLRRTILAAVVLGVALAYSVSVVLGYPASTTQISPSGRFVMENVRVDGVFFLGGMAYLRVVDMQAPETVYRTPLYDTQSLDMRAFENDHEVGIYWIKFDWQKKLFVISMPDWEEHWMNIFVNNTPYIHLKN
ncbi:hypothetical protein [Pseudomonas protegens]|nr:hypothetical protein [Pseudomonas protegens]MBP5119457.1 hypothetical protein [Pseudomonas protegens]MBP5127170.1 hypothetical protein [Pseudomonas protegens]QTU40029.1 hypothetical protein HUT24_20420 [Pseudomonas protegens]